ncbi:hypothetical protein [Streptomyces sp. NBC_00344]|uniref:hypothetical protein n=1 Tax=Streptomyces sp. NBC_00344 TaxID=2975720 RepID=UPI002E1B8B4A
MGRNSPARVRSARTPIRPATRTVADHLDAAAQRDVMALERSSLGPGAVALALRSWKKHVHGPARQVSVVADGCPCCHAGYSRDVLETALRALPRGSARQLRALVQPLDETFLARTWPDPTAPLDRPWWERRS